MDTQRESQRAAGGHPARASVTSFRHEHCLRPLLTHKERMNRSASLAFAALLAARLGAHPEVIGGNFEVKFEKRFRGQTTVLAADDRYVYISDAGYSPDDKRPLQIPRQASDGGILGYSENVRQSVIRLLVCDRSTGEILHEFSGPVSRNPRVSGFELALTSPPVLLEDGLIFLTADWRLQRIRLPQGEPSKAVTIWDTDLQDETKCVPRLNDDIGYLMPVVTQMGEALFLTFNSGAGDGRKSPFQLTMVSVNLADGKLRWVRSLGQAGALDRSPSCIPMGGKKFAVATAENQIRIYSEDGEITDTFRLPSKLPKSEPGWGWGGDVLNLMRLNDQRFVVYGGGHPERGKEQNYPLVGLRLDAVGCFVLEWQMERKWGSVVNPAVGENLYQRSIDGLAAFSRENGKKLWEMPFESSLNCAWATPVAHEGFVYVSTANGLQVYRDGPVAKLLGKLEFIERSPNNRRNYSYDGPSDHSAPVIHNGSIYLAAGDKVYGLKLPLFTD